VQQTVANREYQRLYNTAETHVFELIDKYGNPDVSLMTLESDFPSTCTLRSPDEYACRFTSAEELISDTQVLDTSVVEEYELPKDEYLDLQLNGYRGDIIFSWDGLAALEFALVYRSGTDSRVVSDLFDISGVLDSSGGDPLLNPFANHLYPFISVGGGAYSFRIGSISGLPLGATPVSLRITARKHEPGSIRLNVRGEASFPHQVRKFIAVAHNPNSQANVVASVITQVPLYPQALSIFNYTLLVNSAVTKDTPTF
jgi:hypothetical protein